MLKNAQHPGEYIREKILTANGVSITEAATALRIQRHNLSLVLSGKTNLTPLMAYRIERAFGFPMEKLLRMQLAYDCEKTRKTKGLGVRRVRWLATA